MMTNYRLYQQFERKTDLNSHVPVLFYKIFFGESSNFEMSIILRQFKILSKEVEHEPAFKTLTHYCYIRSGCQCMCL